jgi:hypothetical protein
LPEPPLELTTGAVELELWQYQPLLKMKAAKLSATHTFAAYESQDIRIDIPNIGIAIISRIIFIYYILFSYTELFTIT